MLAEQRAFSRGDQELSNNQKIEEIAPFVNDVQFITDFKEILDKNIQDIGIQDSGAPYLGSTYIEWDRLKCIKCRNIFLETGEFLRHVTDCIFPSSETYWYNKYGLISPEVEKVLKQAQEERASTSYIAKNCGNTVDIRFTIPIASPLAPYILKGLTIYIKKAPCDLKRLVTGKLQIGKKTYKLFFSAKKLERQIDEVLSIKTEHARRKFERARRRSMIKPIISTIPTANHNRRVGIAEEEIGEMAPNEQERRHLMEMIQEDIELEQNEEKLKLDELVEVEEIEEESLQQEVIIRKKTPETVPIESFEPIKRKPRRKPKLEGKRLASSFTDDFLALESSKRVSKQKKTMNL